MKKIFLICFLLLLTKALTCQNEIAIFSDDITLTLQIEEKEDSAFFIPTIINRTSKSILISPMPRFKRIGLGDRYFYIVGKVMFDIHYSAAREGKVVIMELKPKKKYVYSKVGVSKSDLKDAGNRFSLCAEYVFKDKVKYKFDKENNLYIIKYNDYINTMITFGSCGSVSEMPF